MWGFIVQNALWIPSHDTVDELLTVTFFCPFFFNLTWPRGIGGLLEVTNSLFGSGSLGNSSVLVLSEIQRIRD